MSIYKYHWGEEFIYAAATFAVSILTAFMLMDKAPDDWGVWVSSTLIAAGRAVAGAILPRLIGFLAKKGT